MAITTQATACVTHGYYVAPSVSVDAVYDDNLFFASENKESDVIARVSPAIELGYESDTLTFAGRYRFDAEAYADHSELNDNKVRSFAGLDVEYRPTSRLSLGAAADYTQTDTPFDLSLVPGGAIPGLLFGRIEAERTSVSAAASYQFTAPTKGFLALAQTHEELTDRVDSIESDIRIVEAHIEQKLSEVNTLSYGNIYRQYRFDIPIDESLTQAATQNSTSPLVDLSHLLKSGSRATAHARPAVDGNSADPSVRISLECFCANGEVLLDHDGESQYSNTPWIGLSHQFNATTRVSARAGPRLDGGSVAPYVRFSLERLYANGEVLLDYERDETTLLGVPGKMQIQTLYSTISHRFESGLELQIIPGIARVSQTGLSVDIYSLVLGAVYKLNESVLLMAGYDFNVQQVSPADGGNFEVSRNVIQLGVRFSYPRREPR